MWKCVGVEVCGGGMPLSPMHTASAATPPLPPIALTTRNSSRWQALEVFIAVAGRAPLVAHSSS